MEEQTKAGDRVVIRHTKGVVDPECPGGPGQVTAAGENLLTMTGKDPRLVSRDPYRVQEGGSHYARYAIQPAKFLMANGIPFMEGSVIKRMCRHQAKDGVKDLQKAIHEIRLIAKEIYGVEI